MEYAILGGFIGFIISQVIICLFYLYKMRNW